MVNLFFFAVFCLFAKAAPTAMPTEFPQTLIPQAETKAIVAVINTERRNMKGTGMPELILDNKFSLALAEFRDTVGPDWFFLDSQDETNVVKNIFGDGHNINFFHLKDHPAFLKICDKYGLKEEMERSFLYAMHDTYYTKKNALRIFKLRARQRECFAYNKCKDQATEFSTFRSCQPLKHRRVFPHPPTSNRDAYKKFLDKSKCRGWWWYYPWYVHSRAYKVGIISLGIQGRFVQNDQDNTWLAVFVFRGGANLPANNIPFEKIGNKKPCSTCPSEFPKCRNKLCVKT